MKSQREIEYLERFETFSPAKKRQHLAHALAFLVKLSIEKKGIATAPALDDAINGECTIGGAG